MCQSVNCDGDTDSSTIAEQLKRVWAQQARLEAQFNLEKVPAQRSVTSAAEVGRNTMDSAAWPDSR